jgi:hypothetical protein
MLIEFADRGQVDITARPHPSDAGAVVLDGDGQPHA